MTNRAIEQSEKFTYQLVRFSWDNGGEIVAYTDWTSDILDDDGVTYLSRPTMEVKIPKNTGDLSDEVATVDMSREDGFLTDMTNGIAHATVLMTVSEIARPTTAAPSRTTSVTFQGEITLASRSVNGRKNNVKLTAMSPKALTKVTMGKSCGIQCFNNLGDGRCQVDMSNGANSFLRTLNAINGRIVTISMGAIANPSPKYFHRGWILFGGLRIMIRDWNSSDPNVFLLVRQPPASWLGQTVFVSSGCDKSRETCDDRYGNLEHFNGVGIAMPGYLPILESQ